MKQIWLSGPYKGYGAVPAALGNGNGAKPNGEDKHDRIHNTAHIISFFITFSKEKLLLIQV